MMQNNPAGMAQNNFNADMAQTCPKIIGLTGLSGSGKTSVSEILSQNGFYTINCDKIAHEVLAKNIDCYNDVVEAFGTAILDGDGNINRRRLGDIVFADKDKLEKLTAITHYYIIKEVLNDVGEAKAKGNYQNIIIDAPVLIKTELEDKVDEIWVVYSDYDIILERLIQRDQLTEGQIKKRLDNQMPLEELVQYADVVIKNNDGFESLKNQVLKYIK